MSRFTKETFKEYWAGKEAFKFWNEEWNKREYYEEFNQIIKLLKSVKWQTLLEIGCGVGKNLEIIKEKISGKVLYGTDINMDFLSEADKKGLRVSFCDTETIKVPFTPDIILSFEHLQHLHPEAFRNAVKAIKETGAKYILLYEGYNPEIQDGVMKAGLGGRWSHNYPNIFTDHEFIEDKNNYILMLAKL